MISFGDIIKEIKEGLVVPQYKSPTTISMPYTLLLYMQIVYKIDEKSEVWDYSMKSYDDYNIVYLTYKFSNDDKFNKIKINLDQIMLFGKRTVLVVLNANMYNNLENSELILELWKFIYKRLEITSEFDKLKISNTTTDQILIMAPMTILFDILYQIFFSNDIGVVTDAKYDSRMFNLCKESISLIIEKETERELPIYMRNIFDDLSIERRDEYINILITDIIDIGAGQLLDESLILNAIYEFSRIMLESNEEKMKEIMKAREEEGETNEPKSAESDDNAKSEPVS